ncbi:hypothetical protein [Alicyclobacillus mengziensis]|uniref:Uncharacterized protein n=1 Tax=Alicyclobacillus mengziensis TaxID=2931921 RepID=A0A9X7W463_9BACL|nr:hypothetical protein [Alicyclobacillus mengziensis]QSO50140.1 hypothetical protein JZ786_24550 [Alicyclobacillus mengziensis]
MILLLIMLPFAIGILWLAFAAAGQVDREDFRMRLLRRWDDIRLDARARMNNDELRKLLLESGLPLSTQMFQSIRWALILILSFAGALEATSHHKPELFALPLVGYMVTRYQSPFPVYYFFRSMHKAHIRNLNKEVYSFYIAILQSFADHTNIPVTLYQTMKDIHPSLERLADPLQRCINEMPREPEKALEGFANELGTETAHELVGILQQIQRSTPDIALDILEKRYEHFQKRRIEDFKRGNWVRSNLGYVVAYGGIAVVGMTIVSAMLTYATHLNNLALQAP